MAMKKHTRLDLVEGGNIFKQGDYVTLGFIPRDYTGASVDLTNKQIEGSIFNGSTGVIYEGPASFVDGKIFFTIKQVLNDGKFQLEFTVTDVADPEYRTKFPTDDYASELTIKPSADNLDYVGVSMTTVAQLRTEQEQKQQQFEQSIVPQVDELKQRVADGIGAFTKDTEVLDARMGEPLLRDFNQKVVAQLAETSIEASRKKEPEDLSDRTLELVTGGGTVNVLSEPQTGSVDFSKAKQNGMETSFLANDFLTNEYMEMFNPLKSTVGKALSGSTGTSVDAPGNSITDFIMVPKGASLIYRANGVDGFTLTGTTRKIGVWDNNFNFLYNQSISSIADFTATESVYVRIVYYDTDFGMTVKNTKTKKINSRLLGGDSAFDFYKSSERMEFFDPAESDYGKAYSGETSTIVDATGAVISNKVFVPAGERLIMTIDGLNWTDSPAKSVGSSKLIGFDADGNWLFTKQLSGIVGDELRFARDMYLSLQILTSYTFSLKVEGLYKLDGLKVKAAFSANDKGFRVFLFMGQSNMAGRGEDASLAPNVADIAYEYKAITAPNVLSPLVEPFGRLENTTNGINDGTQKTGSMVAAFAKSYYGVTGEKIIGISASKGGTGIQLWIPGTDFFNDVVNRINTFKDYASTNGLNIQSINMVWNQGEGNATMPEETYRAHLQSIVDGLKPHGVEKCFLVRVGHLRDDQTALANMIQAQTNIARTSEDIVLVGNRFSEFHGNGMNLMVDEAHYTQEGYNLQGEQAGINTAYYMKNLKEPVMYDKESGELYFSQVP